MKIDEFSQKPVHPASKMSYKVKKKPSPGGRNDIHSHLNHIPFTHQLVTRGQDLANEWYGR